MDDFSTKKNPDITDKYKRSIGEVEDCKTKVMKTVGWLPAREFGIVIV